MSWHSSQYCAIELHPTKYTFHKWVERDGSPRRITGKGNSDPGLDRHYCSRKFRDLHYRIDHARLGVSCGERLAMMNFKPLSYTVKRMLVRGTVILPCKNFPIYIAQPGLGYLPLWPYHTPPKNCPATSLR